MYDKAKAQAAVDWFPKYLKHTKGRNWKGKPFILLPWQEKIIRKLFGTVDENGYRQYKTVYIEIPKKQGKSTLAAGIADKLLFSDGEPMAEIYGAAADREQAGIVFNAAKEMIESNLKLGSRCKILNSTKRIIHNNGSFYRVLSAENYSKHGYNIHGLIFDELHVQKTRDLYDTLTEGAGDARTQPLNFIITTAGYDRNSICWEVHEYARQVKAGIIKDDSFLPVLYYADEKDDWTSEEVWKKCNPSLGVTITIESLRKACKKAQELPAMENNFRRLRLNQWTKQESRYIPMNKWDENDSAVNIDLLKGKDFYAGLDLASSIDIAALLLVNKDEDGYYNLLPFFFVPEDRIEERSRRDRVPYDQWVKEGYIIATPGNVIDYKFIEEKINDLQNDYDIREIAFDRWGAVQISQNLEEMGFTVVPFGQGFASMSEPTKEMLKIILGGKMRHSGNPVLRWMADNLVVRIDPAENVKPDKSKSTERIDGMTALVMAIGRCDLHEGGGKSIYETEKLAFV